MPSFSRCISICAFAVASCGEPASSPVRLARCCSRTGVITICAMRTASSLRLNCALFASKNALMSASLGVAFSPTSLLDDLLRQQVAAQILAHVGGGEVALLQLLLERGRRNVLLRLVVGLVELGCRAARSSAARLGEQDLLHDQLVQQIQLRRVGLFLRRRLILRSRRGDTPSRRRRG